MQHFSPKPTDSDELFYCSSDSEDQDSDQDSAEQSETDSDSEFLFSRYDHLVPILKDTSLDTFMEIREEKKIQACSIQFYHFGIGWNDDPLQWMFKSRHVFARVKFDANDVVSASDLSATITRVGDDASLIGPECVEIQGPVNEMGIYKVFQLKITPKDIGLRNARYQVHLFLVSKCIYTSSDPICLVTRYTDDIIRLLYQRNGVRFDPNANFSMPSNLSEISFKKRPLENLQVKRKKLISPKPTPLPIFSNPQPSPLFSNSELWRFMNMKISDSPIVPSNIGEQFVKESVPTLKSGEFDFDFVDEIHAVPDVLGELSMSMKHDLPLVDPKTGGDLFDLGITEENYDSSTFEAPSSWFK